MVYTRRELKEGLDNLAPHVAALKIPNYQNHLDQIAAHIEDWSEDALTNEFNGLCNSVSRTEKEQAATYDTTTNPFVAWEVTAAILRVIGWYATQNYRTYTPQEIRLEFGAKLSVRQMTWVDAHIRYIQRACDGYAVNYTFEPAWEAKQ